MSGKLVKNILITLVSVLFMGISLSILKLVDWGLDSFTYMNMSIAVQIGWSFGNWQMLLNVLLFIPVLVWGRRYLGIGTIFNMVLVGYTVDACTWLWDKLGAQTLFQEMAIRVIVMLAALIVFVFAAAIYMSTGLGTSPFDALPLMISETLQRVPFKIIRFSWDLLAVIIGFLFSGRVGVVTILMVLFLGQTVEFVRKKGIAVKV